MTPTAACGVAGLRARSPTGSARIGVRRAGFAGEDQPNRRATTLQDRTATFAPVVVSSVATARATSIGDQSAWSGNVIVAKAPPPAWCPCRTRLTPPGRVGHEQRHQKCGDDDGDGPSEPQIGGSDVWASHGHGHAHDGEQPTDDGGDAERHQERVSQSGVTVRRDRRSPGGEAVAGRVYRDHHREQDEVPQDRESRGPGQEERFAGVRRRRSLDTPGQPAPAYCQGSQRHEAQSVDGACSARAPVPPSAPSRPNATSATLTVVSSRARRRATAAPVLTPVPVAGPRFPPNQFRNSE